MASGDSFHPQPTSLHQSVLFNRFQGVLRAAGRIAAGRRHPFGASLILSHEPDSDPFSHLWARASMCFFSSPLISSKGAWSALRCPRTTISSCLTSGRASLNRRFTRFRRGLFPIERLVVNPTRPSPGNACTRVSVPTSRAPLAKISSNRLGERPLIALARRQSVASLHTASLQSVLPVSCAHPNTKTVRLELMAVIGLVSSLHNKKIFLA